MLPVRLIATPLRTGTRAFGRRTGARAHLPPAPKRWQKPAPPRRRPAVARVAAARPALPSALDETRPAPLPPSALDETLLALAAPPKGGAIATPGARRTYRAATYAAARRAWAAQPDSGRTAAGWTLMVRLAAAAGAPDDAAGLVDDFEASDAVGFKDRGADAVAEVVLGFAKAGRAADAVATFDAARVVGLMEPAPPRRAYDGYVEALAVQRLPERALQVLDDMREAGVRPAASTYAALLKAAATAPQWHRAYGFLSDEILDKLEGEGIAPTPDVFDALVRCAGACGDYVAARAYFDVATRFGGAPSHSRYATYLGALARAVTVGVRGGTRSRSVERAPFDGLGIGEEAAFAPAGNASVSTGEDAGGRGFRRKGDDEGRRGAERPVSVDDDQLEALLEAGLEEDDAGADAAAAALDAVQTRWLADAGADAADDDVQAALHAALAEAGLAEGTPGALGDADDDDVEAFLEGLLEASSEEDLDELMRALPDDADGAPAVATVGGGVPRLREMALEAAPRNAIELRDRQYRIFELAEAAWASLLDAGLAPDAACGNAYYSVYSRALRRKKAEAIAAAFAGSVTRFPDARTARHAVDLASRLGDLRGVRAAARHSTDPEVLGAALDAHARKGDLARSRELCARLVDAYAAYAATGRGASDRAPAVPRAVASGVFADKRRPRGPPERFLRNFRQLCRAHDAAQPGAIGLDPVLWRQRGNELRRSKVGKGNAAYHRTFARP